jgi:serine/threonine-protein kinase
VTGGPVPIVEGVSETTTAWIGQFAISRNGTLAYWPGRSTGAQRVLLWVDRQGHEQPLAAKPRAYEYPRLSPDGTKVAVASNDEEHDLWIWDLAKETLTRLTFGPATELYPTWMPDGRRVVFRSADGGRQDIFRKAADGTGALEALTKDGTSGEPQAISPDGKWLVLRTSSRPYGLRLLPLDGSGAATPLLADPGFSQWNAAISPDGRWIAYQSDESKTIEVYVRPFPAVDGGHWQVSSGGGSRPAWSRSGRELFFEGGQPPRPIAVAIQPGPTFSYGKPQPLFDVARYDAVQTAGREYDVAADGRFITTKPVGSDIAARQTIVVVTHWFDEVKARVR